jgi:S-methylmethionine-dependent homocysteine/selenocysteine methylase
MLKHNLPQLAGPRFLTDGGMETTLIFHEGEDLPYFAAFTLMRTGTGRERLKAYYRRYADLAVARKMGFVIETPTWRANPDWAVKLGLTLGELDRLNADAVALAREIAEDCVTKGVTPVISGNIGPRGDGYRPEFRMNAEEAEGYHRRQIEVFRKSGVDLVTVMTMSYPEEAIGIARAAKAAGLPSVISFTVETDGKLICGLTIAEMIEAVDRATDGAPAYYMINCAHPTHFAGALRGGESWLKRIRGLRTNASTKSHAELDEATELDAGDPEDLGRRHVELVELMPWVAVLGGCCGTDHRHVDAICAATTRAA